MGRVFSVSYLLLIILSVASTPIWALTEHEKAAALDLAIGASSSTLLRFERICGKNTPREERLKELQTLERELLQSFAEIVDSQLSSAEKKQHEAVRDKIFKTIMDDYVQVCSTNEDPATRLRTLKEHAEMFSNSRPKTAFARKTAFDNCKWFGTAPFCNGRCPSGWWAKTHSYVGGGKQCLTGRKVLCCE